MQEIINLINEMSPYLLLGFGIAGLMHTFVPNRLYSRYLSGHNFRSVFYAAALGVPLPLCSCGVLPTAMSLRREGASKGATTSFLIATPQTGIDSIMATYSLMGLPFAIIRPLAALVTALLGGTLVNLFDKSNEKDSCVSVQVDEKSLSFKGKIVEALRYGYVEMMQDIGKWLIIGLLVAGLITVAVPDGFFTAFLDRPLLGMLLVLVCAVPMYLCATGSIPIAVALMLKGMTPGAALVLLMAGPAVNVASILVIRKVLGKRTLWLYLAAIVGGAFAFALGIDCLLPRVWFSNSLAVISASCHTHTPWFNILCSVILLGLLVNALIRRFVRKSAHEGCSCDGICHEPEIPTQGVEKTSPEEIEIVNFPDRCEERSEKQFFVAGMHCNHCRNSVLRAVGNLAGVDTVMVDLQSGKMLVRGVAKTEAIVQAVEGLGFTAKLG
ncbi:MAG: heavy metal-associated domain-containing protein [Bacteroidales bacterium]|nr:heavy metal-associated domain-containing protein [Bacteroidales bacterium]